jgi:hypothetical protein
MGFCIVGAMKKITLFFISFGLIGLSGCELGMLQGKKSAETKEVKGYEQSYQKWLSDKQAHQESYEYVVAFSSWAGFGENTTITVKRGLVAARKYEARQYTSQASGEKEVTAQWTEDAHSLSTHAEGAPAQTLDQVYEQCSARYLSVDASRHTVYFENENNGILSLCGYVPNNCQDDCFTGVRIASFNWLE